MKQYVEFYQKMGFKLLTWTEHHGGSAELQLPGDNQPIFEIPMAGAGSSPTKNAALRKSSRTDALSNGVRAEPVTKCSK
ncbi:hypothetical protein [Oryzicola mucosus]|uniref:Uncharacterized protein n=1 Tax=Oryzicola mucosus TaxID=2767425 RepID=A0A8J6PVC8_9HYPH|nr:hypothetical protein [Oryzicola mucosus]MBD0415486.1 hypothetical protein [Oryzicola mucosus]